MQEGVKTQQNVARSYSSRQLMVRIREVKVSMEKFNTFPFDVNEGIPPDYD